MPRYQFTAKDSEGKKVRGVLEAADENSLYAALKADGVFVLSCNAYVDRQKGKSKIKPIQLADFCRQLSTLLGAGVSLVRALELICKDEGIKPKIRDIYKGVLKVVKQGSSFADALAAQGNAFPELLINMFRASEYSGSMDNTAKRMAEHYEKDYRLNSKVKSATMYPKVLGVVVVGVIAIIFGYVMPQFEDLFAGMELPIVTRFLLAASHVVKEKWYYLLAGIAAAFIAVHFILQVKQVRYLLDRIKIKMKGIGPLLQIVYTARFARTLCSLYTSGIPIVTALQVARNTVGNLYLEKQFDESIAAVRRGEPLSEAIGRMDGFARKLTSSVAIGEESGNLEEMLITMADSFDYEAEMAIGKLVGMLEPCLIVIMAVVVGSIMVGVMIPLVGTYGQIGGDTNINTV